MRRSGLLAIMALSSALHAAGMARTELPAQDGLKFLRIARQFQAQPWIDVIRGSDQHPLYPAAVAAVEPLVAAAIGPGPVAWRLAAQGVSAIASVLLLAPLFGLARGLFDERTARVACLLYAVLPLPGEVGHDTLSDPLAWLLFATALHLGLRAWNEARPWLGLGAGVAAGLGYWTRPEVAVVAGVVLGLLAARAVAGIVRDRDHRIVLSGAWARSPAAVMGAAFLALVGLYAAIKGEVSEKLALRRAAGVSSRHDATRRVAHALPPGLDDSRWDFSPKEESRRPVSPRPGMLGAIEKAGMAWVEAMGWVLAPLVCWGAARVRAGRGRFVAAAYALAFGAVLVRHAAGLGYLSGRHTVTLVIAGLPWAAAGVVDVGRRLAGGLAPTPAPWRRRAVLASLLLVGVMLQARPAHAGRWGHLAAGRWLAEHAEPGAAVLDTRGWAAFASGCRAYDPWHVRQAFTDSRLAYVVIGEDELRAPSRRAATWRAVLAHGAEPVAAFPARPEGREAAVRVFRLRRAVSWQGLGS